MICPHCNNIIKLKDKDKFCPVCGRDVYDVPEFREDDLLEEQKPSLAMIGAIAICGIVLLGSTLTGAYMVTQHKLRSGTEIAADDPEHDNDSGKISVNGVTATTEDKSNKASTQQTPAPSTEVGKNSTGNKPPVTPTTPTTPAAPTTPVTQPSTKQKAQTTVPSTPTQTPSTPKAPKATTPSTGTATPAPAATTKKKKNTSGTKEASITQTQTPPVQPSTPAPSQEQSQTVAIKIENPYLGPKDEEDVIIEDSIEEENTEEKENTEEEATVEDKVEQLVKEDLENKGYKVIYINPENTDSDDDSSNNIPEEADFVVEIKLYNDSDVLEDCGYEMDCYPAKGDEAKESQSEEIYDSLKNVLTEEHGMEEIEIDEDGDKVSE